MKKFQNSTIGLPQISEAIRLAEQDLSKDSEVMKIVRHKNDWRFNSGSGEEIYHELTKERTLVSVYVTKADRPTKALGMYSNGVITFYLHYLETASVEEIRRSLRHEFAHYAGFNHYSVFGTSNFKTKEKCLYSVPYWLSEYGKPEPEIICYRSWKTFGMKKCYEVSA